MLQEHLLLRKLLLLKRNKQTQEGKPVIAVEVKSCNELDDFYNCGVTKTEKINLNKL